MAKVQLSSHGSHMSPQMEQARRTVWSPKESQA